jgi:6-pyruvoyltetrahydropterin/6-carboxytetrahydropterin synthase
MIYATRYHDFSAGHRVVGHESKCRWLHGHNYRVTFKLSITGNKLDPLGRVLDFGVIKTLLCQWLEDNWDHKFLLWREDPLGPMFESLCYAAVAGAGTHAASLGQVDSAMQLNQSLVYLSFNPTAENMANHLLHYVGPQQLAGLPAKVVAVEVSETRKCSAVAELLPV